MRDIIDMRSSVVERGSVVEFEQRFSVGVPTVLTLLKGTNQIQRCKRTCRTLKRVCSVILTLCELTCCFPFGLG